VHPHEPPPAAAALTLEQRRRLEQLYERYGLNADPGVLATDDPTQNIPRTLGL